MIPTPFLYLYRYYKSFENPRKVYFYRKTRVPDPLAVPSWLKAALWEGGKITIITLETLKETELADKVESINYSYFVNCFSVETEYLLYKANKKISELKFLYSVPVEEKYD